MSVRITLLGAVLVAVAACTAATEEAGSTAAAALEGSDFWGEDRVADRLKDGACKVPSSYAEVEECFGIGRKCTRKDSQEVYVIEEKQARGLDQPAVNATTISPRAVVTGCNTDRLDDARSVAKSYSIMVGLFSPPDQVGNTDPLSTRPVEVMAHDRKTGLFNFYVFDASGVTRIFKDGDKVMERTPSTKAKASDGQRCFGCHVNGAPIMNELTNPWTNWVSQAKALPQRASLTGTSKELVALAVPDTAKKTASLAGALETTMKAAIAAYAESLVPGVGTERLLKSVFCETELNYASSTDSIPMQAFWDTSVSSTLPKVSADGDAKIAFQVPVRSELDRNVELQLVERGVLTAALVQAVRLVDDENDVFSASRCALHAEATSTKEPGVKATLEAHLQGEKAFAWTTTQPARLAYMRALLGGTRAEQTAARVEYMKEVALRHRATRTAFAEEGDVRAAIVTKIAERKKKARAMFEDGGPVPVLEPE